MYKIYLYLFTKYIYVREMFKSGKNILSRRLTFMTWTLPFMSCNPTFTSRKDAFVLEDVH